MKKLKEAILITGASTGIGYELAKLFAQDKKPLVLVARNQNKLEEIQRELTSKYSIEVFIFPVDLSVLNSVEQLYEFTRSQDLFIETLVNNAGYGSCGEFVNLPLEDELGMIQLNVTSLVHLTKLYLTEMVANQKGFILNVASTAAFQSGPYMTNYYATKAYVLHFSEGLAEEVKKYGIQVTALCPGPTQTEFQKRAKINNPLLFKGPLAMDSSSVAKAGYKALKKGKVIEIPGFLNWSLASLVGFIPRFIVRKILAFLNNKR